MVATLNITFSKKDLNRKDEIINTLEKEGWRIQIKKERSIDNIIQSLSYKMERTLS